jgi:hypothetical protein
VSAASFPRFTVTAKAITVSQPLTAGLVALRGPGIVLRLRPGVTRPRMVAAIKHPTPDGSNLLALVIPYGGNGGGTNTQEVLLDLAAGTYVLVTGPKDDVYRFLTVAPAGAPRPAPRAFATVRLVDMAFVGLPRYLPAGLLTLKVINDGPSVHELNLGKLHKGVTYQRLLTLLQQAQPSGPPPVDDAGDILALAPHHTSWIVQRFTPGNYAALCFFPDPKTHRPHVALGMVAHFTVR